VFQPCGSINPERENKTKTYVWFMILGYILV
jgi:hypothetical protein